jgi:hemolysin activation/secretion protein
VPQLGWGAAGFFISLISSAAALAQAVPAPPSQVAPPVIAPPAPRGTISVPEAPAGIVVPEAAKRLTFVLTGVDVQGEFPELSAARRALEAPLVGRRIAVAQAFELANQLQEAYVKAGFPLARVVVVPQQIEENDRFKLRVVDGFIERIDTDTLAPRVRERVRKVLAPLLRRSHLTQSELERRLLIAVDTPGLTLNTTIAAGTEVGGSILIVGGAYRPISAYAYVDNDIPVSFGGWQAVASVSANSLFGVGEQIMLQATGLPDSDFFTGLPTRRYLSATGTVPLGFDSLRLEGYYLNGITTPRVDPTLILRSQGVLDQAHVKLGYDVYKRRDFVVNVAGQLDATDEQVDLLQTAFFPRTPLFLDRLRPLRGTVEGIWLLREEGATFKFGSQISQGLMAFGARQAPAVASASDPPLSRAGAGPVFTKLTAHLEITKTLPEEFVGSFQAFGQTAFNNALLVSEQFDIGGLKMLSGIIPGRLFGDNAWTVRGELERPFTIAEVMAGLQITPYLFAAYGEIQLLNPTAVESASTHASNVGAGMRVNLAPLAKWAPTSYGFVEVSRYWTTATNLDGWTVIAGLLVNY